MLTSVACVATVTVAQEDRAQITPGERKVPRKKEAGPRALAVLRLAANGKATLVPITILIDGKFYDASAYKAAPVPMALYSGTVYEGERTGTSLGLFTVDAAMHSTAANSLTPWIGTGKWLPAGTEAPKTSLKAEDVPKGIANSDSDAPPRLSRSGPATPPAPAPSAPAPPASSPAPSAAPTSGAPTSGTPTSTPPASTAPTSNAPGSSGPGSATPADTEAKPATEKPGSDKTADSTKEPDNNSGAGDNNRPKLRRGKPVDPLPDEEIPGYAKVGITPAATPAATATKTPEAANTPVPVQLIPAISDANGPDPRSFTYDWLQSEQEDRRKQITDYAKKQFLAYLDAQTKAQITSKPAAPGHKPARKPADPVLEKAQMVTYDLWNTHQPVIVFSAVAQMPAPAGSSHAATDPEMEYSIMIVLRTDIYNDLHKIYLGVTDKYHLDITPRLELVDAVDADGDGRGELLFRETSDTSSGWLIYRASADKLWKIFDSLNPQ